MRRTLDRLQRKMVLKGHDVSGCGETRVLKGTGFSPYVKPGKFNAALAAEGRFPSLLAIRSDFFRSLFSRAATVVHSMRALAREGRFSPRTARILLSSAGFNAVLFYLALARFTQPVQAQSVVPANLVDQAQKQVVAYVEKLADLHCTEDVVQEKLKPNGGTELSTKSQYDYFLYMQGNSYDFQLSESRLEMGTQKQARQPLLLTNGFSTLLLVFHPYYRTAFEFTAGPAESLEGRSVIPVHFAHIKGARTPAALALRGREFPLDLEGTAWLDPSSGQVVRMDAGLEREMSDVGMKSLRIRVDYMPSPKASDHFMVPARAVVDLQTPKQHWRNTHSFRNYKQFSAEATQDPAVRVKAAKEDQPNTASPNAPPEAASPQN